MKVSVNATINTHKILVTPLVLLMMWYFNNWSAAAFLYLSLHGTYTMLWLFKQKIYPDKNFEQKIPIRGAVLLFVLLEGYCLAPYLLISQHNEVPQWVFAAASCVFVIGIFFHYVGDAQKYFVLKIRKGLIEDGLFTTTRNPNYLGEILIYLGLTLLSWHWLPLLNLGGWIIYFFYNMNKKDQSMSRHDGFGNYKANTGQLFPRIF
ncbi:DUF1295 domain-containing protein [Mucilaginibacter sp. X5P1]|uniref:DUF1295 domain-containing protein n=1 Tax=Mucilaginibacter sp. X5P1 TaxID=2723088 RepID=UPI00161D47CF|nr:DUF1295 domain-containing protein [Mucilaginibacter sp. X5P1]MBB6136872.1 protein-S-isoprenylcysteine O-methyltransferase Ste14 [Mucilaginibacter sp. X5P1]